jgi:hypothetical protein
MRGYLKSAFVIFLTVVLTNLHAQVKPGYIFGLNLSTLTLKTKGISYDSKILAGIQYGGFLEIPLSDNFAFRPNLLFSAKGSNYKTDTAEFSISPIYVEVSVFAIYSIGSEVIKLSLFAGPYLACGISGYKIDTRGDMKDISFGSHEYNDLKPFDVGLNFGAGVSIKGILISAQYGMGLANLSPVTIIDSEMKNKVIGISVCSSLSGK